MVFADMKNDFVFRRIFATHPEILRGLLNDLLERTGDQTIVSLEYLPSEQLPHVLGAKLSVLDVRCRDQGGAIFIVEMQLIHVSGFINRVVYNGCKAYVNQLKAGDPYTRLVDVVAVSICDFELWPDAAQDAGNEPRMPMLTHFAMKERNTGNDGLLQVQYAFLELPKVPKERPKGGAPLWAWLFVHAPELREVPEDLPQGPMRDAMELAKEWKFSDLEMEAYRKVMDEIWQARQLVEDKLAQGLALGREQGLAQGLAQGRVEGERKAKRDALFRVLKRSGIEVSEQDQNRILACEDDTKLETWFDKALAAKLIDEVFAEGV